VHAELYTKEVKSNLGLAVPLFPTCTVQYKSFAWSQLALICVRISVCASEWPYACADVCVCERKMKGAGLQRLLLAKSCSLVVE
jgi:hypothetical protein